MLRGALLFEALVQRFLYERLKLFKLLSSNPSHDEIRTKSSWAKALKVTPHNSSPNCTSASNNSAPLSIPKLLLES